MRRLDQGKKHATDKVYNEEDLFFRGIALFHKIMGRVSITAGITNEQLMALEAAAKIS